MGQLRRLVQTCLFLGGAWLTNGEITAIKVEGAAGANAALANGVYHPDTLKPTGVVTCYKKAHENVYFCEQSSEQSSGWYISDEAHIGKADECYYQNNAVDLPPTGLWKQCQKGVANTAWPTDNTLKVTDVSSAIPQHLQKIQVSGVPTTPESNGQLIDGEYNPTSVVKNSHHCYQKADGTDFWICMGPNGYWLIQPKADLGQATGYVSSTTTYAPSMVKAGPFKLFNGHTFDDTPSIRVTAPGHDDQNTPQGLPSMDVSGVPTTPTANGKLINGVYNPTPTVKNHHHCYQKADGTDFWMCMGPNGYWLIQPKAKLGMSTGYVTSQERYSPSIEKAGPFSLYDGQKFVGTPSIQVNAVPTPGQMLPHDTTIEVSGTPVTAKTNGDLVNGIYIPTTVVRNGRHCFKKADNTNFWICMGPKGYWLIQPQTSLGQSTGYITSTQRFSPNIAESGPFMLFNGQNFVDTPSIQIKMQSLTQANLSWTAALTAVAALITSLVIVWFTLTHNAGMRSQSYRFVSCTMTIFIAVFAIQAAWELFLKQNTAGLPSTSPTIAAVVGFFFFSLFYGSLLIFGWKFQYSHPRLYGLKTLWSNITAFMGIFAFTVIQQECVRVFPQQLVSSIVTYPAAEIITAIGVLLFAWFVLAAYREAAVGFRVERLQDEPTSPWSTKETKIVDSGKRTWCGTTREGCCATQAPGCLTNVVYTKKETQIDWPMMVNEAEEEVAQLILSYLINQTAIYAMTGDIPGLEGVHNVANITYWWAAMIGFTAVALALICCRSKAGDGSRAGRVFQLSMALAASWSMFRLANSYLQVMYPQNAPLSRFSSACVVTCVSLLLMFLADKVSGRLSSKMPKTPGGHDSIYSMKYTFALCFGVISGLAWQKTMTFAVDTLIEGTEFLNKVAWLSELLICWLIAIAVARGWWTTILPKAEMSETAHGKFIQLEEDLSVYPNAFIIG